MNDIQILSKFQIDQKEKLLKETEREITELKEKYQLIKKLVQEEKVNNTNETRSIVNHKTPS